MLSEALSDAAEVAIFGFFCVLDGVQATENGPEKGRFELSYGNGDQRVLLISGADDLHDVFQSMCTFE
jgi:hypothetical protein